LNLRAAFPVCSRVVYLNAGTDGPIPAAAHAAALAALEDQTDAGRWWPHFEARTEGQDGLRAAYARLLNAAPDDVALTTSTSEALGKVIAGLELGPGDEILTADDEHPGLIGPLLAARERGIAIRTGPLADLADHVTTATALIACSHVSWFTGELVDPAILEAGPPVLLDGAQSAGAIAVDVKALGCAAYAAPGQKWLCGADGTGMLYLEPGFGERVRALGPGYMAFEKTDMGLDSPLHAGARRHDTTALPREGVALSLAAFEVLEAAGWDHVYARGPELSRKLVASLQARDIEVTPRGDTTLVTFADPAGDPEAARVRLAEAGVLLRNLPGTPYLRASVGAWNDESDLDRLLEEL
jgi:L-cysteine/cystine lyase